MTRVLTVLLLICPAALAWAEPIDADDRAAIRAVIENQIEAFRRDDAEAAFSYAAPSIQAMFGTPEIFIRMVREDYQAVYRPREVEFQELEIMRGIPTQRVLAVGPNGTPKLALYPMQRQPDGAWRIAGCYLVAVPDESASRFSSSSTQRVSAISSESRAAARRAVAALKASGSRS